MGNLVWNQHRNLLELFTNIPLFSNSILKVFPYLKPCRLYHRKIEISEAEEPSFREGGTKVLIEHSSVSWYRTYKQKLKLPQSKSKAINWL
jgi:hypothetical protein